MFKNKNDNFFFNSRFIYQQLKKTPSTQAEPGAKKPSEKPALIKGKEILEKQLEKFELQKLKKVLESKEFVILISSINLTDPELQELSNNLDKADEKEKGQIRKKIKERVDNNIRKALDSLGFGNKVIQLFLKEKKMDSVNRAVFSEMGKSLVEKYLPKTDSKKMMGILGLVIAEEMLRKDVAGKGMFESLGIEEPEELDKEDPEKIKKEWEEATKRFEKRPMQ